MDKDVSTATMGSPLTICLDKEVDVSRGCVVTGIGNGDNDNAGNLLQTSRMFTAQILWMDDEPLIQGKNYLLRVGTKTIPASVMKLKYKVDVNTGDRIATAKLYKNEMAVCDILCSLPIVFSTFNDLHGLGSLILIDRVTYMTSGCGVIEHSLRRADNLTWQQTDITRNLRAERLNQKPMTIWFTGLS